MIPEVVDIVWDDSLQKMLSIKVAPLELFTYVGNVIFW